jgi:hypothetical protein
MPTFAEFVEELAHGEMKISPAEVKRMRERFGDKTLQMGHLSLDGSMLVPVDCVIEAARSLGGTTLMEAAETLRNDQMASLLQSAEALVERVGEARKRKLERMVDEFQSEPDDGRARQRWHEIEKTIFGVEFRD